MVSLLRGGLLKLGINKVFKRQIQASSENIFLVACYIHLCQTDFHKVTVEKRKSFSFQKTLLLIYFECSIAKYMYFFMQPLKIGKVEYII